MAKAKVRRMKDEDWQEFGEKIGSTIRNEFKKHSKTYIYTGPGIGFPLLIILIGVYFLGTAQGWIPEETNFWAVLFIAIGLWMLLSRLWKRKW